MVWTRAGGRGDTRSWSFGCAVVGMCDLSQSVGRPNPGAVGEAIDTALDERLFEADDGLVRFAHPLLDWTVQTGVGRAPWRASVVGSVRWSAIPMGRPNVLLSSRTCPTRWLTGLIAPRSSLGLVAGWIGPGCVSTSWCVSHRSRRTGSTTTSRRFSSPSVDTRLAPCSFAEQSSRAEATQG